MKKILLILTFFSLVFRTVAQREEILHYPYRLNDKSDTIIDPFSLKKEVLKKGEEFKLDSIYEFDWSTGINEWILVFSSLHTYNIDHTRDYSIYRTRDADSWLNYLAQYFTYDGNGNRETELVKAWNESLQEWLNYKRYLFSYNDFNNLTQYIYLKWNSTFEVWNNYARYIYDYDEEQNWIYYERQDWNPDSLRWELNYRFIYTYENGLKTSMLRQNYNTLDSAWVNNNKHVYNYDTSGNLIEEIQFVWQSESSTWVETTRITFIRDQENQVTEKIYQTWITGAWENTVRYTYQYEFPGKEKEIDYFIWDGESWIVNYRYLYEYDVAGILTRETDQKWITTKGNWENDYKWEYYSSRFYYPLEADITDSTNISCHGYQDGSATVTPSGGTPPYTYLWDDPSGTTDSTIYGLSAGQYYTVTVTDADLNSVKDSVILSEPDSLHTYFSDSTNISCYGYSDGSAVISVSGGTPPYSYLWDDEGSSTDSVVFGLIADTWYRVLVTDNHQCEKEDSIILSQPEPLNTNFSDTGNVSCYGYSDGWTVITVSGGTPPFTYLWDDELNTTDSVVYGLSANIWYHILVTDSHLCWKSDSIILTQPLEIITGPVYGDIQVDQYDTVTYRVESDPLSTYSWEITNGTIYYNEGVDSIIVIWNQSGQGIVTVVETAANGCSGDAVSAYISISPTGIIDNEIPLFQITPNPAEQFITINTRFSGPVLWDLSVYDLTGKCTIKYSYLQDNSLSIYVGNWNKGVYFFRLTSREGIVIRKVIVK
ncbi:MAG: T9SS type A sorting domain-containing protein [Bacteroidales bacterium]|nr:MAG: T9SS type A sorting domain-containing protein [Bacteroidales bacterium]